MENLSKDVLAYILLDCAVGNYQSNKYYFRVTEPIYVTEWNYLAAMRSICKKWKQVIDTYIYRYISLRAFPIDAIDAMYQLRKPVVTQINVNGQRYRCSFNKIKPIDVIKYSSFIHGAFDIDFKYGMTDKKCKRKASLNIYVKTSFNEEAHTTWNSRYGYNTWRYTSYPTPQTVSYIWTDKHGSQKVVKGWKKMIGEHILEFILRYKH